MFRQDFDSFRHDDDSTTTAERKFEQFDEQERKLARKGTLSFDTYPLTDISNDNGPRKSGHVALFFRAPRSVATKISRVLGKCLGLTKASKVNKKLFFKFIL
jgi:hypothetical protein